MSGVVLEQSTAIRDRRRRESGVVLAMVLILTLLLTTAVAGFTRRTVVDRMVVANRNSAARAEALARGGIQMGLGVLLQERAAAADPSASDVIVGNTYHSLWYRLADFEFTTPEGDSLRIYIEDEGSKLNLNSFVPYGGTEEESVADPEAEEFLVAFLDKVIEEIPLPPGEKFYETRELAQALLDFVDSNEDSSLGGFENDWYQQQDPPYAALNRPFLTVDELSMVKGFDSNLMKAIRPYVTVYPLSGKSGINVNTAPAYLLATVYHGSSGDMRLADEDIVRQILRLREDDRLVCTNHGADPERCTNLSEIGLGEGSIYPPSEYPAQTDIFTIVAEARAGEILRSIEATVDRVGNELGPQLLSWRVR